MAETFAAWPAKGGNSESLCIHSSFPNFFVEIFWMWSGYEMHRGPKHVIRDSSGKGRKGDVPSNMRTSLAEKNTTFFCPVCCRLLFCFCFVDLSGTGVLFNTVAVVTCFHLLSSLVFCELSFDFFWCRVIIDFCR